MHDSIICGCAPLMGNTVSDRLHYAHLTRTHFDVEVVTFVSDLENFRPRKTINPQLVAIDQQTSGAHTNHNLHAVLVLTKYHIKVNKQDATVCCGARTNLKVGVREKFSCALHFFVSTSKIGRFGEHFRDGQYSLVSFFFAVLLLMSE